MSSRKTVSIIFVSLTVLAIIAISFVVLSTKGSDTTYLNIKRGGEATSESSASSSSTASHVELLPRTGHAQNGEQQLHSIDSSSLNSVMSMQKSLSHHLLQGGPGTNRLSPFVITVTVSLSIILFITWGFGFLQRPRHSEKKEGLIADLADLPLSLKVVPIPVILLILLLGYYRITTSSRVAQQVNHFSWSFLIYNFMLSPISVCNAYWFISYPIMLLAPLLVGWLKWRSNPRLEPQDSFIKQKMRGPFIVAAGFFVVVFIGGSVVGFDIFNSLSIATTWFVWAIFMGFCLKMSIYRQLCDAVPRAGRRGLNLGRSGVSASAAGLGGLRDRFWRGTQASNAMSNDARRDQRQGAELQTMETSMRPDQSGPPPPPRLSGSEGLPSSLLRGYVRDDARGSDSSTIRVFYPRAAAAADGDGGGDA